MFKYILRKIIYILDNEDGFLFMTAVGIGSLLSSHGARKAKMRAQVADSKLQRARLERARTRNTDVFSANTQRAKQATQKREVAIEANRIDSESSIKETFAGSGISGSSVDDIDNELEASVVRNKYENVSALDEQLADLNKSYGQQVEDINEESKSINTTTPRANVIGDISKAVSEVKDFSGTVKDLTDSESKFLNNVGKYLSL